jgi:TolB-like protein
VAWGKPLENLGLGELVFQGILLDKFRGTAGGLRRSGRERARSNPAGVDWPPSTPYVPGTPGLTMIANDRLSRLKASLASRYSLQRELGRGGMATVYLAQDLQHDRPVALKVLHPELAATLGPERFLREIKLTARLQHPHILPVFDSGDVDGQLWYAMPFVEGRSLRARLASERQLPLDDAIRITCNVLAALSYAHGQGVVHRDIKPENILLEADEAVVADFGIARAIDAAADRLTETGLALGTPAYMSPEQAAGERAIDGRSDLFAVGCVLYEMLAGEPPFTGPTPQAILAKRFSAPIPSLRITREGIPEGVDRVISRALARAPADRFPTAAEFSRALEVGRSEPALSAAKGGQAVGVTDKRTVARARAPSISRRQALLVALSALLVIGGAWLARRWLAAPLPAVSLERLAVLPFATSGSANITYLADGMVDLLSRNLNGAADLRTIDAGTVLTAGSKAGTRPGDAAAARALARRLGAGLYVLGSVHAVGGRLRIQADLYSEADTSEATLARATAEGDTALFFQLVDRLSADLLAGRGRGLGSRLMQSAALTTSSLGALKHYLDGERNLRGGEGEFDSAIAGFQRAIAKDSTFALAYYRLGVAGGWAQRPGISGPATQRALALGSRLENRDRRLLSAFAALQRGAADEAEQQYRAILRDYPDDLEAEFQLADLYFHYNAPRGRPISEAREPFDRVLALDPGFLCPI